MIAKRACVGLLTAALGALTFLAAPSPVIAGEACKKQEIKMCDVRKFSWCGPIELVFWQNGKGEKSCDKAQVTLTPTDVSPSLRRIRCYFFGDTTTVRFIGENYKAVTGPDHGDEILIRHGVGEAAIHGQYRTMKADSDVFFQNIGPGESVILKCNGYGPA